MSSSKRRRGIVLVSLSFIVLLWTITVSEEPPASDQQKNGPMARPQQPRERFDEPDAAARYQRMKRQGPSPDFDTVAAYRKAHAHLGSMPRYSTRLGAPLARKPLQHDEPGAKSVARRTLGEWSPLGPGNIGGRTRTLVIHPAQPDIMYAGGVSGGVWKTTDGGQSWTPLADRIANIAVNSMAIHPEDPDVLYVGTGEGHFREIVRGTWLPLRGAGIFKTEDGGATWSQLPSTDNSAFHWVNDLIISPKNPDVLYAATRTGVHLSGDGGQSWSRSLDPEVNGGCLDLALRTDLAVDWLFASCGTFEQSTVYRRRMAPSGEWEAVLSEPGMGRTSLAIAPSNQTVIYALSAVADRPPDRAGPGGDFHQSLHAVYRSTAGGSPGTWTVRVDNTDSAKLNTLLLTNPLGASYVECGEGDENSWTPMGWYCNVIAVDPVDPNVVWAGGVDLFRSDDGGSNWGLASYWFAKYPTRYPSYAHADQHAIVFHPDYDGVNVRAMFSATDGGIFRTDNPHGYIGSTEAAICDPQYSAVRFVDLNHGFGITQFYHGAPYPGADGYLGGTQDNGTILGFDQWGRDGWVAVWGGDGGYVAIDPQNQNNLYIESQWFNLKRSTDGGYNFQGAVNGIPEDDREDDRNFLFITPFVMDPNNSARLWAGGRRLWRTDNMAVTWAAASSTTLGSGQVSALAVAPGDSDFVVVGTTDGYIYRNDEALEAGSTTVWQSSRPRAGFVSSLAFDPSTPGRVYATFAGFGGPHVWRSHDDAVTWEAIDGTGVASIPDIPVHSIVVDPDNTRRLYVGTDLGVMTSTNGGLTWATENTGFANAVTEWLALETDNQGDPWLFAFTHGRGAWRVQLNSSSPSPRRPNARRGPSSGS
jgi:photosystem II stability/assembly factor-like uncharacterized protein